DTAEDRLKAWKDSLIHLQLQQKLRAGATRVVIGNALIRDKFEQLQAQVQDPMDFYQGTRTDALLIEYIEDYINRARSALSRECLDDIIRL
ncbi:MAG: hypothetical protein ACK56I_08235, partial [bacterium]